MSDKKNILLLASCIVMNVYAMEQSSCSNTNELLLEACQKDDYNKVVSLLKQNAQVNSKDKLGMTPLMHASEHGYLAIVKALLENGAHVNDYNNNWGTALMYAAIANHENITKLLLRSGADINAQNIDGKTVLDLVEKWGSRKMEDLLKAHGAHKGRMCIIS